VYDFPSCSRLGLGVVAFPAASPQKAHLGLGTWTEERRLQRECDDPTREHLPVGHLADSTRDFPSQSHGMHPTLLSLPTKNQRPVLYSAHDS